MHWVGQLCGLHPKDAYQLCSRIAQVPVANVVDANSSVAVKAAKAHRHRRSDRNGEHPLFGRVW